MLSAEIKADQPSDAWDAYVADHDQGSAFHRAAWPRAIVKAMGHRAYFVEVRRDGALCGVLPLIEIKSRLFGHSLTSSAFAVYGGPLANDAAAHEALDTAAIGLADRCGVGVMEYRNQQRLRPQWAAKEALYVTFRWPIVDDSDAQMKMIKRKQRAMVRKAIGNGLRYQVSRDTALHHNIYAQSVHNLGTPVFPRALFDALLDAYGDDADILTVYLGDAPVASVLSLYHKQEVLPYYGGGTAAARGLAANDYMYWALMEHARSRGCTSFDFGRSKVDTGAYAFKKNWGFEPQPLAYEYWLAPGRDIPDVNPLNPKYALMIKTWKRMPLWLANRLGPVIARNLG